jgi:hypothetical protein
MTFLIAIAALSVLLVAPIVHADNLLYADRFSVHDATGARIGTSSPVSDAVWRGDAGFYMTVEFRLGGTPVIARWRPSGFEGTWLRFPQRGCMGQVFLHADFSLETVSNGYSNIAGPRSTVYVETGPAVWRTMRSALPPTGVCQDTGTDTHFVVPARATSIHLADIFVPPFAIQTTGQTPVPRVP